MPSNITIQNNVNSLSLSNAMSGGLESSAFAFVAESIPAMQSASYLWFNRDEGVKDGKTYTFVTTCNIGMLEITITISLTGTATSSNYWIEVSASSGAVTACTPQISDTGTYSLYSSNDNGALLNNLLDGEMLDYSIYVERSLVGSYDDVTITINPAGQFLTTNQTLPPYQQMTSIPLLDVWGEGRIYADSVITGFTQAYNLNVIGQMISNGPNKGQPIPNMVPVSNYNNPVFPLASGIVQYETLMGSPIVAGTVQEMLRVLNPTTGVVILYDPNPGGLQTFQENMGNLVQKANDPLNSPFNQISFTPALIFGFPEATDKDEL